MRRKRWFCRTMATWAALCVSHASGQVAPETPSVYRGMCDASAAVALGPNTFMVADNEINILQIYRSDRPGLAGWSFRWDKQLGIDPAKDQHPQADIEGATWLDNRVYWITSHGRNKDGKWRKNRHRFLATTVRATKTAWTVEPFGRPYEDLMVDLVEDQRVTIARLAESFGLGVDAAKKLAPKEDGLNIEGLTATADGKSLLIGFRNPLVDGRALLVPLGNPAAVLTQGAHPEFGKSILLDLAISKKGKKTPLSIRSIEYSKRHGAYLIAAGPPQPKKVCAVFRWSGVAGESPKLLTRATAALEGLGDFTPEALVVYPTRDKIQLLSDDGTRKVKVASAAECQEGEFKGGECEAKFLLDDRRKTFRDLWVEVQ